MHLTPDLEAELRLALNTYWNSYLEGDIDTWASYLADEYHNIGTTEEEVWQSKQEILEYTRAVIQHLKGGAQLRNKAFQFYPIDPYFMVHELGDMFLLHKGDWMFYAKIRMTSLMEKRGSSWKILHQHGSYPDANASQGDVLGFDKIKRENNELREAVQRKTIDLEIKNRELEIEAALERVRAVAMGMKTPNDMLEVCKVIAEELEKFGVRQIRNIQTVVISKEINEYTCYQYFTQYQVTAIEQTHYQRNRVEQALVDRILDARGGYFEGILSGEDLDVFRLHRKREQFVNDPLLDQCKEAYYFFYSIGEGALGITLYENLDAEGLMLFKRFHKVFSLAYQRFRDIEKAEAQAQEATIETALERVRSKTMAMHNSADVGDTAAVMVNELHKLGIETMRCGIGIMHEPGNMEVWTIQTEQEGKSGIIIGTLDMHMHPLLHGAFENWRKKGPRFSYILEGDDLIRYYEAINNYPGYPIRYDMSTLPALIHHNEFHFPEGVLFAFSLEPLQEADKAIFQRFAGIFGQTYRRYLDLIKAEAQAREAQIEAALERIRGRSMAMHNSHELQQVIKVFFEQLTVLNVLQGTVGITLFNQDTNDAVFWVGNAIQDPQMVNMPYEQRMYTADNWLKDARDSILNRRDIINKRYNKAQKDFFFEYLFQHNSLTQIPENAREMLRSMGEHVTCFLVEKNTSVCVDDWQGKDYPKESIDIIRRATKVFDQAYARFLDIQKAEAQAREAQIESALESVRSKALAMRTSEDIAATTAASFEELRKLGVFSLRSGVGLLTRDSTVARVFADTQSEDGKHTALTTTRSMDEHPALQTQYESWKLQKDFEQVLSGEELTSYYNHTFFKGSNVDQSTLSQEQQEYGYYFVFPDGVYYSWSLQPYTENEKNILHRFRNIIALTFRRYLDLQKAEVQTREAEIELALERVRARTMAMQHSSELSEVVYVLYKQMQALGFAYGACTITLFDDATGNTDWWMAGFSELEFPDFYHVGYFEHEGYQAILNSWRKGEKFASIVISGESKKRYDEVMFSLTGFAKLSDPVKAFMRNLPAVNYSLAYMRYGAISYGPDQVKDSQKIILLKFANLFEQSYTRFLDLQKAEAQAWESRVEAALEKVRSRTLAMHRSDELAETAAVMFRQLIILGIAPNRLYIILFNEGITGMEAWLTDEDGSKVSVGFTGDRARNETLNKMYQGWITHRKSLVLDLQGDELQEYLHYLHDELKVPFKGGMEQKRRLQHIAYFSKGLIGMASPDTQPSETVQLLERFAAVFNLTFTRFNDLKIAEAHALQAEQDLVAIKEAKQKAEVALSELQATQKQLIQSEKMASLGELTAGIAHEIQNPLNFVNNFSEVSKELIDELKVSLAKGDVEDAMDMMADLVQNLEKINEHGKRADGIVKGMLQHSRAGSGQKEPTDINAMADECLRLAFHGLRAKDKSFNANFELLLEPSLGKIEVMPQDMGRVLLNLINNAFYAVNEKSKRGVAGFKPLVKVTTEKKIQGLSIKVEDNGDGIPENIREKIFHPFFTTKPTGQGTGLGLSLAYDIVKAHGGELTVESREGEGTGFFIYLPNA